MNWLPFMIVSVQATLVATLGLLTSSLIRSAAHRHCVLLAALMCILASPLFYAAVDCMCLFVPLPAVLPAPRVSVKATPPPRVSIPDPQEDALAAFPETTLMLPQAAFQDPPSPAAESPIDAVAAIPEQPGKYTEFPLRADFVLAGIWLAGTLFSLAGVWRSHLKTVFILKTARPVDRGGDASVIAEAERRLDAVRNLRVATTGKIGGPAVVGLFQPSILIPVRFLETLFREELLQVLIHEGAHVLRRDPLVALLQRIGSSLFWWNPLVHLVNRNLTRAREEVCDNFVLTHTEPEIYGATLLRLATLSPAMARLPLAIGMFDGRGKLEDRIRGLLDSRRKILTRVRFVTGATVLSAFALFSVVVVAARGSAENSGDAPADAPPVAEKETEVPPASLQAVEIWPTLKRDVTEALEPAPPDQPGAAHLPKPEEIERAKQMFRNSRDDSAARAKAVSLLYPLIKPGTPRLEVLNLLGAPDRFPKRESYSRFLNYVIGQGQRIEIEFDRNQAKVVRKQETGLGIDRPRPPTPPIPDKLQQYLADYVVEAKNESDRTVLRAGFIPDKPQIVWGEPLVLTMTVANVGAADFEFMFGGDYRGTGRHDRIKIMMTDAKGNEVPDPHADAPDFGGISAFEIVTPGGLNFTHAIDLTKFRTISGPGQYTLTCSFAFGEPHTDNQGPAKPVIKSSFPFTILERTPERVAAILDELQAKVAAAADEHLPEAIAAIARFGQDDAVPRLGQYTKTGPTARRTVAFAALPLVPGEAVLGIALASLSDADPAIRIAAYSALGRMPEPRSIDALLNALTREQPPVLEAVLVALGTSKSSRVLPVLSRTLGEASTDLRSAAVSALVQFSGPDAVAVLRRHVDSPDLAFRYQVVRALVNDLRSPLNPEWLVPILMCRRHNSREWLDSLNLVRINSQDKALPVLLSCVDYGVPWSHRNFWVLHYAKYAKGAPEFDYHYDPNSQGTPEQHEQNRNTLRMLRTLAGPIPETTVWPSQPVPPLETIPRIDFTTTLSSEQGEGETPATIRCGYFQESWNRNGGSVSFKPSEVFRATYQLAEDVRAILASSERAQKSGLTEPQLQELRKLEIPPHIPVIEEGLTLLYIWWHESPDGPIRQRASDDLRECVRAAVQKHHTDHVAFAAAARKIMGPVQNPAAQ